MFYESNISIHKSGEVTVVTTGSSWERGKNYRTTSREETTYHYPSVEQLRRSLVREKLSARTTKIIGGSMLCGGTTLFIASLLNMNLPIIRQDGQAITGLVTLGLGYGAWREGRTEESKVNSRINAFNDTLPSLKPIPLNIRDYLAKRIPFLHR